MTFHQAPQPPRRLQLADLPPCNAADLARVRKALSDTPATAAELGQACGITPSAAYMLVTRLVVAGDARRINRDRAPCQYTRADSADAARPWPADPSATIATPATARDLHLARLDRALRAAPAAYLPVTWDQVSRLRVAVSAVIDTLTTPKETRHAD